MKLATTKGKTMRSSLVEKTILADESNYTKGRQSSIVKFITPHHTAGVIDIENLGTIWQNPNRNASSHYGIGYTGRIASYVDEEDTAWTNSNWKSNKESITIEVSNDQTGGNWHVSDESIKSLINLMVDIAKRYNLVPLELHKNVSLHKWFTNTTCPGPYLEGKMQYIIDECNKKLKSESISLKSVEEIAEEVIDGKWGNNPERKQLLENAGYNYKEVQKEVNAILYGKKGYVVYVVQKNDTLYKIAEKFNTKWEIIFEDNKDILGGNPNLIFEGQKLKIRV